MNHRGTEAQRKKEEKKKKTAEETRKRENSHSYSWFAGFVSRFSSLNSLCFCVSVV